MGTIKGTQANNVLGKAEDNMIWEYFQPSRSSIISVIWVDQGSSTFPCVYKKLTQDDMF